MKLQVENLANIEKACINVKNLTLFVGQNSTHKSYMAHIIYELYKEINNIRNLENHRKILSNISKELLSKYKKEIYKIESLEKEVSERTERYQLFDEEEFDEEKIFTIKINIDNSKEFLFLQTKAKELILEDLANIVNNSFNTNTKIVKNIFLDELNLENEDKYITMDIVEYDPQLEKRDDNIAYRIVNNIVSNILKKFINLLSGYKTTYYFPASRTGFVLALDEIYAGIFRDKFRGQVSATKLGEPTIDFMQNFADIKMGKQPDNPFFYNKGLNMKTIKTNRENINRLIKFLQEDIIKGEIKEQANDQNYKTYYLDVNNKEIDLHLASSATLETLPFIVFIKNTKNISKTLFVLEEPEAHLHPKAQIQIARFLVLLANTGAKVLVTTHSDYILSEINNCIKLNSTKENNKEVAISKDDVSAYLFSKSAEKKEIVVSSLEIDKYGISNENFDEVLDELMETSNELNKKIVK